MNSITTTSLEVAEVVRARRVACAGAEWFSMGVRVTGAARRRVLASMAADRSETARVHRPFGAPSWHDIGRPPLNSTKTVRRSATKRGVAGEEALKNGMEDTSKESTEKGAEFYAKV